MNKKIDGINSGYFPVYWELFEDDNLTYKEVFFLHYLLEVYPTLRKSVTIDSVEYKRLSDSYVQEDFDVSRNTIRDWFKTLEDNGYIKVYHSESKEKGIRYFTILLEIDNPVNSGYYCGNNSDNNRGNNRGKKYSTKETIDTIETIDTRETIDIYASASKPAKPVKNTYGEYNNVKLTDKEYEELKTLFPYDYTSKIRSLDEYIESLGKDKYKNHLLTIKTWARKETKNDSTRKRECFTDITCSSVSTSRDWNDVALNPDGTEMVF